MNQAVHIWIQRASAIPGVLACGVRCVDQSLVAQSYADNLPIPRIQSALREVLEIIQALQENRIGIERLRWTFEKGRIHCTARADGAVAALLVLPEMDLSPEIDGLLSEFGGIDC